MGIMDKLKAMVNPEDSEENEDYVDDYDYGADSYAQPAGTPAPRQTVGSLGQNTALELKVVRPERFDAVTSIADHLINNRTVILNLEATSKETASRMIDFLSGVAYSIEGKLKRVDNNTFVITPGSVAVSQDATVQQPAQDEPYGGHNF